MSYVGPDSHPPRPPRRFRGGRPLAVALAVLVPGALAGYLLMDTASDSDDGKPARTLPSASRSEQGSPSKPSGDATKSPKPDKPSKPSKSSKPGADPEPSGHSYGKAVTNALRSTFTAFMPFFCSRVQIFLLG